MKISVDDKADRDALATILARNGYIVKMTRYKKTAKSNSYLDGAEWREIAEMLFSFKPDFDDSDEKYLRRTFKLHREAIDTLNERLSQQRPNPAAEMQEILLPKWTKPAPDNGMKVKETKSNKVEVKVIESEAVKV